MNYISRLYHLVVDLFNPRDKTKSSNKKIVNNYIVDKKPRSIFDGVSPSDITENAMTYFDDFNLETRRPKKYFKDSVETAHLYRKNEDPLFDSVSKDEMEESANSYISQDPTRSHLVPRRRSRY